MILALVVTLVVFFFPVIPLSLFRRPLGLFSWSLPFHIGLFCLLASATYASTEYSLMKLIAITVISGTFVAWFLPESIHRAFFSKKLLLLALGSALLLNFDTFLVLANQGWGIPGGRLWDSSETLLHSPFQSDPIRNVMLSKALMRRDNSPFLPHSPLVYQLFWFHGQTAIVAPLQRWWPYHSFFQLVQGVSLGLGIIFSFVFICAAIQTRPTLTKKPWLFSLLLLLFFTHADLYHALHSLLVNGKIGIEADWSFSPLFFRNASFKLMYLFSPQHIIFILFQLTYWFGHWRIHSKNSRTIWESLSLALGYLVSPPMAVLFYPAMTGIQFLLAGRKRFQVLGEWILYFGIALGIHAIVLGNPFASFMRKAINQVEYLHGGWWNLSLPIYLIGSTGVVGLITTYFLFFKRKKNMSRNGWEQVAILIMGGVFTHYVVTSLEIRRHVAMWFTLITALFLVRWGEWKKERWIYSLVALVLFLHAYFLFCYLGKPSTIDPHLAWSDYFAMNEVVEKQFPKMPIVVATEPVVNKIVLPPIMEVTTSFAFGGHVYVHSKMNEDQLEWIRRIESPDDIMPYAERLGYTGVLWGPVEDRVWGEKFKKRFIHEPNLLARVGQVGLYKIEDGLIRDLRAKKLKLRPWSSEAEYFRIIGEYLTKEGWLREAVDNFQESIIREPNHVETLIPLARALVQYRKYTEALDVLSHAKELAPHYPQSSELRGICLAKLGKYSESRMEFETALKTGGESPVVYFDLAQVYLKLNEREKAKELLKRAMQQYQSDSSFSSELARLK